MLEVESQLVHVLQAHSTALQSERTKSEIVQKSHQVLLVETKALEAR